MRFFTVLKDVTLTAKNNLPYKDTVQKWRTDENGYPETKKCIPNQIRSTENNKEKPS